MASSPTKILISYCHDSTEHKEFVLRFARRLRKDSIDAQIDQFVSGRPQGGWPRWMLDRLDWAEFVFLICTETYRRRFRGHEKPGASSDACQNGNPIPNAKIDLAGRSGITDSLGHFEFVIPGDRLRPQMEIEIAASGYEPAHYTVVPNSEHVVIVLNKSR
jgi:hypothetical protein